MMKLEVLANELFIDIFEYLDFVHLFRAFYGLNSRFNTLISTCSRISYLDFRGIWKNDFNLFCQQYLSSIVDRIISIHLPNGDETPNLLKFFLSHRFTLDRFIHLQSLSLYDICSVNIINQIIEQCHHIQYISLIGCYIFESDANKTKIYKLFDHIWSLPNLVCFCMKKSTICGIMHIQLTVISTSIKYLIFQDTLTLYDPFYLLKYTPNLQRLCLDTYRKTFVPELQINFPLIVSLNIKFSNDFLSSFNFLQYMPNLSHLKLEQYVFYSDGFEWERIITNHLSKLNIFQLKSNICVSRPVMKDDCDLILNSFRTSFWLEKHQWFVRCVCPLKDEYNYILYTLPYSFDRIEYKNVQWSKSTCPNETDYCSFNHVKSLGNENLSIESCNDLHYLSKQFPKLHHIKCDLTSFKSNSCLCSPLTNHLTSIHIALSNNKMFSQTQTLLDYSPYLYSLTIFFMFEEGMTKMFQLTSKSIHRLELLSHPSFSSSGACFTKNQYQALASSSLGQQCQVLSIIIKNQTNLLDLLEIMPNLRSLNVQLTDDTRKKSSTNSSTSRYDAVIRSLSHQLPSTYSIIRNEYQPSKNSNMDRLIFMKLLFSIHFYCFNKKD